MEMAFVCLLDVSAILVEACSLHPDVFVHVNVLVEFMYNVGGKSLPYSWKEEGYEGSDK